MADAPPRWPRSLRSLSEEPTQTDERPGTPAELPPAGWFPDPERPGMLRWWDGAQWTEHRTDDPAVPTTPAFTGPSRTSGWAVASLILGIVGGALFAIVFGAIAKDRIRRSGGALTGDGMATAGIVLGSIWAVVAVAALTIAELEKSNRDTRFTGDKAEIARVADRLERAFADDRGDEACADLLTVRFAAQVARGAGQSCPAYVDDAVGSGQYQADIRVRTVTIRGDTATAKVSEGDDPQTWTLRREQGTWRIDAIRAT